MDHPTDPFSQFLGRQRASPPTTCLRGVLPRSAPLGTRSQEPPSPDEASSLLRPSNPVGALQRILAVQHHRTLQQLLTGLPVNVVLVRSALAPHARREIAAAIAQGEAPLVIGTHALLEGDIRFHRLGLVVIDEQHRFGVNQRLTLERKALRPDVLVMTATPIPRTLALTAYGDLDVSVLDEQPPGRPPILTRRVSEEEAYRIVREAASHGRQAYIVYPLIEASDRVSLRAATQEAERLRREAFPDFRVGLLHGRLKETAKQTLMEEFRDGRLDILIATTVIEVGVDVPQASVMVVHHADRFGLSTLHQLRGRVGRRCGQTANPEPACCLLIGDPNTPEAERRLAIMVETTNGFLISEADLSLRGPGEVIGLAQHGLPELKIGDLIKDVELIALARQQAFEMVEQDPHLSGRELVPLRQDLRERFRERWRLAQVG
ncbi:MAG: DEAD/DEAH box helicase [Elusimicrobia bacterium]|nr:DEAD/DEAH box helicase [Elusimicrobiota bacterium]